jgi:hypothetical protein
LQDGRRDFDLRRLVSLDGSLQPRGVDESVDHLRIGSEGANAGDGPNQVSECCGQATILKPAACCSPAQTLMNV